MSLKNPQITKTQTETALNLKRLHSLPLACFRFTLFVLWMLVVLSSQSILLFLKLDAAKRWPMVLHRVFCWILGIKIEVRGKICKEKPTFYVSNHASYIDILVIGSLLEGAFIAKKEIESWPIFGYVTKLQRSIFVERKRTQANTQKNEILERLQQGGSLFLFPEGTSSDGNRVLPFKSSLFSFAQTLPNLPIQPISVSYATLNGIPVGRMWRPFFAWYGDMNLMPHMWQMMGMGTLKVIVEFHPPMKAEIQGASRKEISTLCEKVITFAHNDALHTCFDIQKKKKS